MFCDLSGLLVRLNSVRVVRFVKSRAELPPDSDGDQEPGQVEATSLPQPDGRINREHYFASRLDLRKDAMVSISIHSF